MSMQPKEKNKGGRPTKYTDDMPDKIIKFFDWEPFVMKGKDNRPTACVLPTLAGFARSIGVNKDTLHEWSKESNKEKYPGFSDAKKRIKAMQEDILITNGLMGLYDKSFAIFTAKNILRWSDRQEIDHTTKGKELPAPILPISTNVQGDNVDD